MTGGAVISDCEMYRYSLWRQWNANEHGYAMFIGLNPSVADAVKDDPTIRRCRNFAASWGDAGLVMVNLFAYRATEPKQMMSSNCDVVGPNNDAHLLAMASRATTIVCAWGTNGDYQGRDKEVLYLLRHYHMKCLDITVGGHPWHPLYMKQDTRLKNYP